MAGPLRDVILVLDEHLEIVKRVPAICYLVKCHRLAMKLVERDVCSGSYARGTLPYQVVATCLGRCTRERVRNIYFSE